MILIFAYHFHIFALESQQNEEKIIYIQFLLQLLMTYRNKQYND